MLDAQPLSTYVTSAQRGVAPEYDANGTVPVVRTVNVRELKFSDTRQEYVPFEFFNKTEKGIIDKYDIVITSTGLGTLGRVFCNLTDKSYFADGHITVLKPAGNADYAYITAVLQSDVGRLQFEQWQRGSSGQLEIYPDDILGFLIPRLPQSLVNTISYLWSESVKLVQRSELFYPEAEQELLERLSWEELAEQPAELFFIENTDTLEQQERIDAEHFQPKYWRLRERLNKLGALKLGAFCPMPSRGVQPVFDPEGEVAVLASKAIRPQGVAVADDARTSKAFWGEKANEKARVYKGDVLLNSTGVGTLGRASFYLDDASALADNHVAILRPSLAHCLPPYLSLFLNSPAGIAQSEMFQTGSSGQLEIYPQHITEIFVYLPRNKDGSIDLAWQQRLADKVVGASQAKQQAQAKLAEAKKLVEDAVKTIGLS